MKGGASFDASPEGGYIGPDQGHYLTQVLQVYQACPIGSPWCIHLGNNAGLQQYQIWIPAQM